MKTKIANKPFTHPNTNSAFSSDLVFKGIIESAPDAIIIVAQDGKIEIANKEAVRIFGYTLKELIGASLEMLLPERFKSSHKNHRKSFYSRPKVRPMGKGAELFGKHKSGKEIPVEISISPIEIDDNTYVSAVIRDVTERKEIENELKLSNERNKIFVQQSPNAIAMFDTEMRYLAYSQKWLEDYGIKEDNLEGKSHYDIFPEIKSFWKKIHNKCLKGEIDINKEVLFERKNGEKQWISWDIRPWYLSQDTIGGLLIYTDDITKQKERELSERRLSEIFKKASEVSKTGTWDYIISEKRVDWNRIARDIFEVTDGFIPDFESLFHFVKNEIHQKELKSAINRSIKNGLPFDIEVEITSEKGNDKWIRIIGMSEFHKDQCIRLYGIFQNVNDYKRALESLQKANTHLNTILNVGHVSIILTDAQGTIRHINKGAEILLQYSESELVGKHSLLTKHLKSEIEKRGKELTWLMGREIKGFDVFVEVAKSASFESREWTLVRKDGSTFPAQVVINPVYDSNNNITGYISVATDLTEIKNAQKAKNELIELTARQNERAISHKKMEALLDLTTEQNERLKNFTYIVSHNLNSHSKNISHLLEIITTDHPSIAKEDQAFRHLKSASGNLLTTLDSLNDLLKIDNVSKNDFKLINLWETIEKTIAIVSDTDNLPTSVENAVDKNIEVYGLPAYLDSIIWNFLTNAIKYRSLDNEPFVKFSSHVTQKQIVLSIEDNGIGIDLNRHGDKLFGLHKTFNGNEDARGVGLFITKNQVEALGGKIHVESELGKGTTFKIFFKAK